MPGLIACVALSPFLCLQNPPQFDGSRPAQGTTSGNAAEAVAPAVQGDPQVRAPETYGNVINQFAVGVNPRYRRRSGDTFCNIFVWDVTRAMGAEVPHWVDGEGRPRQPGEGWEMNANTTMDWLHSDGGKYGWRQVSPEESQALANKGHPAIAILQRRGPHGHMAVVRPGEVNGDGPTIAQAGSRNTNSMHAFQTFPRQGTEFWVNDEGLDAEERVELERKKRMDAILASLKAVEPEPSNWQPPGLLGLGPRSDRWWADILWFGITASERPFVPGLAPVRVDPPSSRGLKELLEEAGGDE